MTKALVIVLLAISVALPSATAEEVAPEEPSEPDESGAQGAPGPEDEPGPSDPDDGEDDPACAVLGNGDMTENSLPVAPDVDTSNGFFGIFFGTPDDDKGYSGQSFGLHTQCVPSIGPDGLCVPEITCPE